MPPLNELNNDNSAVLDSGYDDGMTSPGFHHQGKRTTVEPRDIPDLGFRDLSRRTDNRGFANLALEKELSRQFAEVPVEPVAETAPTIIESATGYDDGMTWPGFHHHGRRMPIEPRAIAGFGFMELCLNADNAALSTWRWSGRESGNRSRWNRRVPRGRRTRRRPKRAPPPPDWHGIRPIPTHP